MRFFCPPIRFRPPPPPLGASLATKSISRSPLPLLRPSARFRVARRAQKHSCLFSTFAPAATNSAAAAYRALVSRGRAEPRRGCPLRSLFYWPMLFLSGKQSRKGSGECTMGNTQEMDQYRFSQININMLPSFLSRLASPRLARSHLRAFSSPRSGPRKRITCLLVRARARAAHFIYCIASDSSSGRSSSSQLGQ